MHSAERKTRQQREKLKGHQTTTTSPSIISPLHNKTSFCAEGVAFTIASSDKSSLPKSTTRMARIRTELALPQCVSPINIPVLRFLFHVSRSGVEAACHLLIIASMYMKLTVVLLAITRLLNYMPDRSLTSYSSRRAPDTTTELSTNDS